METTVEKFIYEYGRKEFVSDTGYSEQTVSRAIVENVMPAGWLVPVRECCEARGTPFYEGLFRQTDMRKQKASAA